MARWRLMNGHYLNILLDGERSSWEHRETNQTTGRMARKIYPVPVLLDPNDSGDHNYPGEIIVTDKATSAFPKDIVFFGDPTPHMEPLDEAAEKITEKLAPKWKHPIDTLPTNGVNFNA